MEGKSNTQLDTQTCLILALPYDILRTGGSRSRARYSHCQTTRIKGLYRNEMNMSTNYEGL